MKKAELIDALAEATDLNKTQVDAVLDALPGVVLSALKGEGSLTLPGIAKIEARARPARKARNPATGAEIKIAATTVAGFKPVKPFKDAVAKVKVKK
ncbi:MAG: HU family DNA-binding protein [Pseudomonadota bacterium]